MSNYFAPAKASTSTMAMEAATSAPAVGYTVEQVRAQQSDRSFRRDVQNVHLQIIELAGEHPRSHMQAEECEALAKRPTKEIDRAQSAPKKGLHAHLLLLTHQSVDISINNDEHGSLSSM